MIDDRDVRFLASVFAASSLTEAARREGVSQSAVSQRLSRIENGIGMKLLNRSSRLLEPTEEGAMVATHCRRVLAELESLRDAVAARVGRIEGELRLVAPFGFGRRHVAGIAGRFREMHPAVRIELILSDRIGRPGEGRFDIAIHVGDLPETGLIKRRLAPNRRLLCAAPAYLFRCGPIGAPADLLRHQCIALRENEDDGCRWTFSRNGQSVAVSIAPAFTSNDGETTTGWALAGRGVMVRSEWEIGDHLRAGALTEVLPEYRLPDADVVALYAARALRSQRVVAFGNFIAAELARTPWRA